jgi:C1A family cysteine protease
VNARGFNSYVNGGSFTTAVQYISEEPHWLTVETETDYPYSGMSTYIVGYNATNDSTLLPTLIASANYYKPFAAQSYNSHPTPAVAVVFQNSASPFSASDRMQIKSYLSRGFAISVAVYSSAAVFENYNGNSYVTSPCTTYQTDHAPTLVGYGTYNNKEVWVIKNSCGTGWGANGFAYVPIGSDDLCMEHNAYAIVPKYYTASDGAYSSIGS